jgi:hypothetical protein
MKGLQVDDGRNRNRDPLLLGPKNALARRPLVTMRPFDRCTVVAVVIQRANIGLIMKNSTHGIEIPFPITTRRRSSLQCELLGDLANRRALLRIETKNSANHHRFVLIDLHMWRHTVTTWNAHITERGSPGNNRRTQRRSRTSPKGPLQRSPISHTISTLPTAPRQSANTRR